MIISFQFQSLYFKISEIECLALFRNIIILFKLFFSYPAAEFSYCFSRDVDDHNPQLLRIHIPRSK